jgi:hypothetical protein
MSEYRDELAMLAEEHGIPDEQRASFMLTMACYMLEAKDRHEELKNAQGLGLARRGANLVGRVAASEPQHVAPPLRGREGHSHAERGTR